MTSDLLSALIEAALVSSAAVILVLVLRLPLRRWLGARLAYATWALVPASVLAVWLPAPAAAPISATVPAEVALPSLLASGATAAQNLAPALLLSVWASGALALALVLLLRQYRFNRGVRRQLGQPFDETEGVSPAVTGLFRPRIALPLDFHRRYQPNEQHLVIAHERMHVRRLDVPAQALASALRCLFWFNPLFHFAGSRFRFDQELACDADVLAVFPSSRRSYGEAMLKTQLAELGLPLGCHWQASHPLKERIAMLKQPLPGLLKRRTGTLMLAAVLVTGSYAAWAMQPSQPVPPEPPAKPLATETSQPRMLQAMTDDDVLTAPKYPASAIRDRIGGKVMLEILVGEDGRPKQIKVRHSTPEGVFDKQAVAAAEQWQFNAGRNGARGEKVEGWVLVPVQFSPDGPPDGTEVE